jgi:hypothetical protein
VYSIVGMDTVHGGSRRRPVMVDHLIVPEFEVTRLTSIQVTTTISPGVVVVVGAAVAVSCFFVSLIPVAVRLGWHFPSSGSCKLTCRTVCVFLIPPEFFYFQSMSCIVADSLFAVPP